MSKKFLRPVQGELDDNSDSDEEDEDFDDDNDDGNNKMTNKEDDEDGSDDDDDDDEEKQVTKAKTNNLKRKDSSGKDKAKKKVKTSSFFDMEAEDSGDDDDEDGDGEAGYSSKNKGGSSKKMDGEVMDEETKALIRQQDRRRAQGGGLFGQGRSVAEISREIEERHRVQQTRRPVDRSMIMDRPIHDRRPMKGSNSSNSGAAGGRDSMKSAGRKSSGGNDVGGRSSGGGGGNTSGMMSSSSRDEMDMQRDRDDDVIDDHEPAEVYTAAVAQQSLVPSVSDPSLWMVSCLPGKEQELVFQIMNKCVALARTGRPLGISAAIAAQSKAKIYIESFSEPAVMEAIQGVRGLMQYSMKLVPIADMTTVMTVVSKKKPVKKNEWVRMTRGHYKGDLALVKAVKESGLKCIIQCVPRLDLTLSDLPPEEARIRRRTIRPAQKFFNIQEVTTMGKQTLKRQRFPGLDIYCDYFEGNYYQDGYLLKEMTVGSMVTPCTDEDPPTLDELQSFQRRKQKGSGEEDDDGVDENEGSKVAASLLDELSELQGQTAVSKSNASAAESAGLLIGDTVEVIEGDLIGMIGKLISLDGSTVKVQPTNTNIDLGGMGEVEFLANQVRKYIPVGAHVKVTDGRYANETGTVVAIEQQDGETDFTAVVLTDVTNKEISVRTSQLRESAEVASGQDKLSGYELYDLVVLTGGGSANEVGVIVRVGREDFTAINNHGLPREVRPEELRGKRNTVSNRAVALDVQGNQIRCGDTVNVAEGPHKGKTATIKRMSRAQLFLHSQTRTDHAGVFVVRSRSCVLAGTRSQSRGGSDGGGLMGSSPFSTPLSNNSSNRGGPPGGRPGGRKDDSLVGKTVRIQAGQWKGFLGAVVDTTATHVQVELHARLKKVLVVREKVAVVGDKFGATGGGAAMENGTENNPTNAMATPMHVPIGGATPAIHSFGGATPSHTSDDNDDVWRPGGTIDQDGTSVKNDDGWGSTSENNYDLSTKKTDNDDSGWGSSSNGVAGGWGTSTANDGFGTNNTTNTTNVKNEFPVPAPIKRETITAPPPALDTNNGDVDDEIPVWFMERVCIKSKDDTKTGVIREINADKSALVEWDGGDGTTQIVRVADVTMVAPVEHDTVLITGGNEIGLEGSLVCVDGSDAILKDPNDEFKIIDFVHLVKISAETPS